MDSGRSACQRRNAARLAGCFSQEIICILLALAASGAIAMPAWALPDLVITSGSPSVSPSPVVPGQAVYVSSYTVKNQGNTPTGNFQVGFYISTDPVIAAGDHFLGYPVDPAPNLAANQQYTVGATTITLPVPANLSAGTYYVGILADWSNAVAESNESNNYVSTQVTVGSVTEPDLVITAGATPSPLEVPAGGNVSLSDWTVKNQGTAPSGTFENGFYLSSNATITPSDTYLGGNTNTSLSPAGQFTWGAPILTIPPGTAPGTYYIGVLVDMNDDVAESDENNNYVSSSITVTEPAPTGVALPSGVSYYEFLETAMPVVTDDPSTCEPIGVGDLSLGVLSIRIGLPLMENPVDVYLALYAEAIDPGTYYLITETNTVASLADGLVPRRENVLGPLDEPVFGDIPIFLLPAGTYYLYLAVTPAGAVDLSDVYLWSTSFVIAH